MGGRRPGGRDGLCAHSLQRYGAAYHLDEPKTRKSRRTLPLPGFLVAELRAHMVRQLQERLLAGSAWTGDVWGLVFTTAFGDPLGGTAVTRHFQRLLEKAELPRWRFHDLRHAAATFMLARGVNLRTVMEVLGHSTITLTANTYGHVALEVQRDATEQVAAALFQRS
ncbi:MAG: site-specific integrase [Chloroflexota bacterium]|nr:site-specific integrase [Chloroflexota bacterium]